MKPAIGGLHSVGALVLLALGSNSLGFAVANVDNQPFGIFEHWWGLIPFVFFVLAAALWWLGRHRSV